MNENEEMIYSEMGLDPILLLEEPPLSDNYKVNIIRHGLELEEEEEEEEEEKNKITEASQEVKRNNSNKIHKKNSKDIVYLKNSNLEDIENIKEVNPNLDLTEEAKDSISADNILVNEKNESSTTETKETEEDPRRKRRRSSANS